MSWNNELGRLGEDVACRYLEEHGLCVIDRNWHCGKLEIDIIARRPDENLLHIVEVRTRSANSENRFLTAAESVTVAKQKRLINATKGYMNYYRLNMGVQFDIVAVHYNLGKYVVEWIPDAFIPKRRIYW
ncbi:MAG: YraN family protein [Muribaculaceae bacterium]|nr:YraN family protein [Muribaculaceae bacterium]